MNMNILDYYKLEDIGIFIHTDCYKYVNNKFKIKLTYSDIPIIYNAKIYDKINPSIKYGDIEKYWEQDFDFINLYLDNKVHLCSSPLKDDKNLTQIKQNLNKMKLNKDISRKGPSVSATFYSPGDIKIGNNKTFWIKKSGKWSEMKDDLVNVNVTISEQDMKKYGKFIMSFSVIGQYNKNAIFVKSIKQIGKKFYFSIITTDEHYKKINKLFNSKK
jgi:hypothetical protein